MSTAATFVKTLLRGPILVYRFCVSPFTASACRHIPTCSQYAEDAIDKNGPWKGSWLTISRLLRCNPWGSQGLDPVPDLTNIRHPKWAPWRYGCWSGRHISQQFYEPEI